MFFNNQKNNRKKTRVDIQKEVREESPTDQNLVLQTVDFY